MKFKLVDAVNFDYSVIITKFLWGLIMSFNQDMLASYRHFWSEHPEPENQDVAPDQHPENAWVEQGQAQGFDPNEAMSSLGMMSFGDLGFGSGSSAG